MLCAEPAQARDGAEGSSRGVVLRVLKIVRPVIYPRRKTIRKVEEDPAGEGGAEEGAAQPQPPASILRSYEGQLLSNDQGEPITYTPRGEDWPFTWRTANIETE